MPNAREAAAPLSANAIDNLPAGALAEKLAGAAAQGRPLRVKLGIDPTAPDIHLGHAVVLRKLREFQEAGHLVVLIIGDYTARVGDPSGRSTLRPMLSDAEIEANAATFQQQALKILDGHPERLEVRRNGEWLDMRMAELLALVRTTTVAQLLERDDFARRWGASEPISMLELLYPLLQGYDSVAVRADVELGGPTRSSTYCSAAMCNVPTSSPSRRSSRCQSLSGPTEARRCRSRWATTSASPRSPRRCTARR